MGCLPRLRLFSASIIAKRTKGLSYSSWWVKATEDDEWGGHAWPVVALDNHEGWGINGVGAKANLTYFFVESTAYYEGSSDLGVNPWYEITDEVFYDVEE